MKLKLIPSEVRHFFRNVNMCILFPRLILPKVTFLEAMPFQCYIKGTIVEIPSYLLGIS